MGWAKGVAVDTAERSSRRLSRRWSAAQVGVAAEEADVAVETPNERAKRELNEQRLKTMTSFTVAMGVVEGASRYAVTQKSQLTLESPILAADFMLTFYMRFPFTQYDDRGSVPAVAAQPACGRRASYPVVPCVEAVGHTGPLWRCCEEGTHRAYMF